MTKNTARFLDPDLTHPVSASACPNASLSIGEGGWRTVASNGLEMSNGSPLT
jgi:hypothetical protein